MLASEYYGPFPLYKFKQTRVLNGERLVPNSHAWLTHVFGLNEEAERALPAKYPLGLGCRPITAPALPKSERAAA